MLNKPRFKPWAPRPSLTSVLLRSPLFSLKDRTNQPLASVSNWRRWLLLGLLLPLLAAPAVQAQTASEAMAFPRQVLSWYLAGEADQVWEHAHEGMRALMESPQLMKEGVEEFSAALGAETAVLNEQTFEHPDGDGWHVYVRALSYTQYPELFWLVIFSPADRVVVSILPQPRQTVRAMFPQVTLP